MINLKKIHLLTRKCLRSLLMQQEQQQQKNFILKSEFFLASKIILKNMLKIRVKSQLSIARVE